MSYDDIPTALDAFKDDDKVANAYCAIKWLCWQLLYMVFLAALTVGVIALIIFSPVIAVIIGLLVGGSVVVNKSKETARENETVRRIGSKTKQTPGLRRIYNECPITFKTGPRWYEKLTDWLDEKIS